MHTLKIRKGSCLKVDATTLQHQSNYLQHKIPNGMLFSVSEQYHFSQCNLMYVYTDNY